MTMRSRLRLSFFLTLGILAVEIAAGLTSHSLALLSDAGHVLTDVAALGAAWFAAAQAARPANARRTFGYHRVGILAALGNSVTLLLIVVAIAVEALNRFRNPQSIEPGIVIAGAAVAIVVNIGIARSLHQGDEHNLNARAAILHVLGDIGASIGVLLAAVIVVTTGRLEADPTISLAIAVLIAVGAVRLVRETTAILLESTPPGVDLGQLISDIEGRPGVTGVHDLHVWSIDGSRRALSAHVAVTTTDLRECQQLSTDLSGMLESRFAIAHATLQFECDDCETETYCEMEPARREHAGGHGHGR